MNNSFRIFAYLLAFSFFLLVGYNLASTPNTSTYIVSPTGCCSITVVTHEYDALYDITYYDNTLNTTHHEEELNTVDMEYTVNLYQEHCYLQH